MIDVKKEDQEAKELIREIWEKRHPEETFFMSIFKSLKIVEKDENIHYFKNEKGEIFIEQDKKNKNFWLDYKRIWTVFESRFNYNIQEISEMINPWLERELNCDGYTTYICW